MKLKRLMAALTFAAAGVSAASAVAGVDPSIPSYTKARVYPATCRASAPTPWPT